MHDQTDLMTRILKMKEKPVPWVPEATRLLNLAAFGASLTSDLTLVSPANGRPDLASELPLVPRVRNRTNAISDLRVPYTLSDNRITQNYLAFSRITGNLKQDFTFTKKSKLNSRGRIKIELYQESRITKK